MTYTGAKKLITPLLSILLIEGLATEFGSRSYASPNFNQVSCGADQSQIPYTYSWSSSSSWNGSASVGVAVGKWLGKVITATIGGGGGGGGSAGGGGTQAGTIVCTAATGQIGSVQNSASGFYTKDASSDCANGQLNAPAGSGLPDQTQQCGERAADVLIPAE